MDDLKSLPPARTQSPIALGEMFRQHHGEIFGFLCAMTGDREQAADLTQEVFLRAWRHRHTFRGSGAVRSWLFQIARNLSTDAHHQRLRRPQIERQVSAEEVDPTPEPERRVTAVEALDAVHRALAELPESQREVLLLARVEGMSYAELAELTGCSTGALRVRISRALVRLRKVMKEQEGGRNVA